MKDRKCRRHQERRRTSRSRRTSRRNSCQLSAVSFQEANSPLAKSKLLILEGAEEQVCDEYSLRILLARFI
jgi:hypothetical protein